MLVSRSSNWIGQERQDILLRSMMQPLGRCVAFYVMRAFRWNHTVSYIVILLLEFEASLNGLISELCSVFASYM